MESISNSTNSRSGSENNGKALTKPEHIRGINRIIACIGTPEQFRNDDTDGRKTFREVALDTSGVLNVDHMEEPKELAQRGFKTDIETRESFVISPIDNLDKFSAGFIYCTGLIAVGKDVKTGEDISFMSHQNPRYLFFPESYKTNFKSNFIQALEERLEELQAKCVYGTIDVVIVGGAPGGITQDPNGQYYYKSVELLSEVVSKALGFEPTAMTGPKLADGENGAFEDNIFFDNKNRRLYISRPKVGDATTESFTRVNMEKQKVKWS